MKTIFKRGLLCVVICAAAVLTQSHADRWDVEAQRKAMEKKGAVQTWAKRDWSHAYQYKTRHYHVTSNTTREVCEYIGDMMELAYSTYAEIFQYRGRIPQLPINAYADMDAFREVSANYGFRFRDVAGFYTSEGGGAIYLPYLMIAGEHPITVLLHEGAHQFIHNVIDMPVPTRFEQHFEEHSRRLNSTPIWLNEGLACYLETAKYDGAELELGRVNQQRLAHLQYMLKNSTAPSISETVSRKYGQPFTVEHYAVAWGLVWYLRHDSDVDARDARRVALNRYIEAVKLGFFEDPDVDFKKIFMTDEKPREDFPVVWREYVGRRSLEVFLKEIVKSDDITTWETTWKEWIMKRNPRYDFGGTKRGEAVFNQGDLRLGK